MSGMSLIVLVYPVHPGSRDQQIEGIARSPIISIYDINLSSRGSTLREMSLFVLLGTTVMPGLIGVALVVLAPRGVRCMFALNLDVNKLSIRREG
jgi:hypothetical protein